MRGARRGGDATGFFQVGDTDSVVGLVLGGDYCAEHECGIDDIRQGFGISDKGPPGIGRYQICGLAISVALVFCDRRDLDQSVLCFGRVGLVASLAGVSLDQVPDGAAQRFDSFSLKHADWLSPIASDWLDENGRHHFLRPRSKKAERDTWKTQHAGITGAWDNKEFFVRALGDEARRNLSDVFNAFLACDVAISTTRDLTPFGRGGLSVVIPSRMAQADLDRLRDMHADRDLLDATFRASGIPGLFVPGPHNGQIFGPHARPSCFALKPEWTSDYIERRKEYPTIKPTEDDIRIFLNPMNQQYCNYGWFAPEDIRRWFDGEGPVVKAWVERQKELDLISVPV